MKCPLCQSQSTSSWFSFNNPRRLGPRFLAYRRCHRCQIVYLFPRPTAEDLQKIYSHQEYFTRLCRSTSRKWLDRLLQLRLFPEYWDYINSQFNRPETVLDVGCGNGEFLIHMSRLGWEISGSDLSPQAISNAKKLLGADAALRVGDIVIQKYSRHFSAITMWHVLEHVPHPWLYLKKVSNLLLPGGKFILEVPNSDSLLLSLFKNCYNWLMVPEHVFYYSPTSLKYLFKQSGLKVVRFDFPPRALLNFSLSLAKIVPALKIPVILLTLPLSVIVGLVSAFARRGEVVRVVVSK